MKTSDFTDAEMRDLAVSTLLQGRNPALFMSRSGSPGATHPTNTHRSQYFPWSHLHRIVRYQCRWIANRVASEAACLEMLRPRTTIYNAAPLNNAPKDQDGSPNDDALTKLMAAFQNI